MPKPPDWTIYFKWLPLGVEEEFVVILNRVLLLQTLDIHVDDGSSPLAEPLFHLEAHPWRLVHGLYLLKILLFLE